MKKLLVLLLTALSFSAFASSTPTSVVTVTPIAGISSVMTGSIGVGTNVVAAVGQAQTQTSIGSLTGSAVIANALTAPSLTTAIVGTASSVTSGTGYTMPSYLVTEGVNSVGVSAVTSGTVTSTLTNVVIPTTTISVLRND